MSEAKQPKKRAARHPWTKSDSPEAAEEAVAAGTLPRRTYRKTEVAAMLGVTAWKVNALIEAGELGVTMLGKLRVIPAEDVDRLIAQGYERKTRSDGKPATKAPARRAAAG